MVQINTKQILPAHVDFSNNTTRNSNTMRYFYYVDLSSEGAVEKEDKYNEDGT